jgi:hypothetical protein
MAFTRDRHQRIGGTKVDAQGGAMFVVAQTGFALPRFRNVE